MLVPPESYEEDDDDNDKTLHPLSPIQTRVMSPDALLSSDGDLGFMVYFTVESISFLTIVYYLVYCWYLFSHIDNDIAHRKKLAKLSADYIDVTQEWDALHERVASFDSVRKIADLQKENKELKLEVLEMTELAAFHSRSADGYKKQMNDFVKHHMFVDSNVCSVFASVL